MKTGKKIRAFEGHTEWVTGVCISSSGDELLTCSRDNTAILWSMETGGKMKVLISGDNEKLFVESSVRDFLISPNGYIFAIDDKYNVRLCVMDITAEVLECNDVLRFDKRLDHPDLIVSKVNKEMHPLEVDTEFTFFRNKVPLKMPIDNYMV